MRRPVIAAIACACLLLTACTAKPAPSATSVAPGASGGLPGGTNVIAPTLIDPTTATSVSVPLGSMVVFNVENPEKWSATVADTSIATFQAGGNMGTYVANPGVAPVAEGTTTVTVTAPDGTLHTFTLTVSGKVTDLVSPPADLGVTQETTDLANSLIGMTEDAAVAKVQATGRTIRIARRDKETFALTMDYRPDRINIQVDNGKVTSVDIS